MADVREATDLALILGHNLLQRRCVLCVQLRLDDELLGLARSSRCLELERRVVVFATVCFWTTMREIGREKPKHTTKVVTGIRADQR